MLPNILLDRFGMHMQIATTSRMDLFQQASLVTPLVRACRLSGALNICGAVRAWTCQWVLPFFLLPTLPTLVASSWLVPSS